MSKPRFLLVSLFAMPIGIALLSLATTSARAAHGAAGSSSESLASPLAVLAPGATLDPAAPAWFGYSADPAFKEKYKKAMEKGAKPELEKLVKSESTNAAAWIARANEILAERPDDPDMGPLLASLTVSWTGAMKSTFPEKEKQFFVGLAGQNKKDRADLRKRFDVKMGEFDGNSERKDALTYAQIVDEFEVLASAFDQIGDHYLASEAWIVFAACYDEPLRGQSADLKRALSGLEKALAERAKVDLADARRDEIEKRRVALVARLNDKGGADGGKAGPGQGPSDAGATIIVPLAFEVVPAPDTYARPIYTADDIVLAWRGIQLKGKGSSGSFETLPEAPTLWRLGDSDLHFDSDRDGKADGPTDTPVPMTGNVVPVRINLGKGGNVRPWAFLAALGGQQDSYQGIQMNMGPAGEQMTLYTLPAASVVGTLETTPIRILDDSFDGLYGSVPLSYGFPGLVKNSYQPEMDCIVIGSSKRARPWSEIQEVGGKWWKFEMASTGKDIRASPIRTDTGFLKLEYKGGIAPTWLVMRGANEMKDSFFDIAEAGSKGLEVPIGRYTLYYGELRKGKKKQVQKCMILPSKNAQNYDVSKGGTTVVTLGAPYGIEFAYKSEDGKITVTGPSVVVTGSQGERYERPWNCIPHVEAGFRKKGTKKANRYDKMPLIMDNDGITKLGWDAVWFPLDLVLDAKGLLDAKGQGEVEVQLVDKKHELFGKIESEWK